MHIALRRAHAEPRLRLRTVVKAEHCCNDTMQFVWEMDCTCPPAIGAARVLEGFQIDPKRIVELGDCAGKHDGAACCVFLDDNKTVRDGKLPNRGDVSGVGSKLLGKLLAAEMPIWLFARHQLRYMVFQGVALAMTHDHTDFQPFSGFRLADGSRSPHGLSFATDKCTARHR